MSNIQRDCVDAIQSLDEAMDNTLTAQTMQTLSDHLGRARSNGKTQWWNPTLCPIEALKAKLVDAVNGQDYLGAMTYAAMLEYRSRTGI